MPRHLLLSSTVPHVLIHQSNTCKPGKANSNCNSRCFEHHITAPEQASKRSSFFLVIGEFRLLGAQTARIFLHDTHRPVCTLNTRHLEPWVSSFPSLFPPSFLPLPPTAWVPGSNQKRTEKEFTFEEGTVSLLLDCEHVHVCMCVWAHALVPTILLFIVLHTSHTPNAHAHIHQAHNVNPAHTHTHVANTHVALALSFCFSVSVPSPFPPLPFSQPAPHRLQRLKPLPSSTPLAPDVRRPGL